MMMMMRRRRRRRVRVRRWWEWLTLTACCPRLISALLTAGWTRLGCPWVAAWSVFSQGRSSVGSGGQGVIARLESAL